MIKSKIKDKSLKQSFNTKLKIEDKIHFYKNLIRQTILSIQTYKKMEIIGASELNISTTSLENIYKEGYQYQKTGIIFSKLKDVNIYNKNLFSTINNEEKRTKLMKAIDYTNIKYGRHALSVAQAGFKKKWNTRRRFSSRIDTACFDLLPFVKTS